jgi:hypothetical protein
MSRRKQIGISVIGFWIAVGVLAGVGLLNAPHYAYLQTVALILTLIAVLWYAEITRRIYREIQLQSRTAIASHTSYKLSVAAEWLLKLDDRFNAVELTNARLHVTRELLDPNPEGLGVQQLQDSMEELWDFFDTLGALLRRGVLDKELLHSTFFHWVNAYWLVTHQYLERERQGYEERWKDFVFLVMELRAFERENHPNSKDLDWSEEEQRHFMTQEAKANLIASTRFNIGSD